ncbi:MAG: hypothetical protein WC489_06425 [Patescibacteria group bacterium]
MSEISPAIEPTSLPSDHNVSAEPASSGIDMSPPSAHRATSAVEQEVEEQPHRSSEDQSSEAEFNGDQARTLMQSKLHNGEITEQEYQGAMAQIKQIESQIAAQAGTGEHANTSSMPATAGVADADHAKPKSDLRAKAVALLDKMPGIIKIPILLISDIISIPLKIVGKVMRINPMKPLPKMR